MQTFKSFLADKLSGGLITPLLFLPLAFYYFTLFIKYPEQQSLLDDWFLFIFSITLMFYGYLLGGSEKFWNTCERYKYHYLITSVLCIIILFYNFWWSFNLPKQNDLMLYLYGTLNSIHIWLLILAALGFAKKYLNFSNRFLQFTNQAVYPFYILHQTIIVTLGFYIVQLPIPIFLKLLILLAVTFIAVFAIYRFIIKPFIITRILYGLKPREKNNSPFKN